MDGGNGDRINDDDEGEGYDGDQTLDFGDILAEDSEGGGDGLGEGAEAEFDEFLRQDGDEAEVLVLDVEAGKAKTEMEIYESKPVLWSGGVS